MDLTGYGRSHGPTVMNDPVQPVGAAAGGVRAGAADSAVRAELSVSTGHHRVGVAGDQRRRGLRAGVCAGSIASVSSRGRLGRPGPAGFTVKYPEKVESLVLLAPAFNRAASGVAPAKHSTRRRADEHAVPRRVRRPTGTARSDARIEYDPAVRDAVWSAMLESDPVGATWGAGVRRAPSTAVWGWNHDVARRLQVPISWSRARTTGRSVPDRVRDLHADLGSSRRCSWTLAVPRTTRCGSETTRCCSRRRSTGSTPRASTGR